MLSAIIFTTVQLSKRPNIILLLVSVMILSCSATEKLTESNYHLLQIPPNGVVIADNFFCDLTEMDNIGWLEYMYWTADIFGSTSAEYMTTLPDTLVWRFKGGCFESCVDLYLKHPAYQRFPVVGITQHQAIDYSKWRSNRFFEVLLIRLKKIEFDSSQNKDSYFTIEKYFNGTFGKILPGDKVKYYPNFRLPTLAERKQILQYADSVDRTYFEKCNSKYCKDCKANFPKFYSDIIPCKRDSLGYLIHPDPTISTYSNFSAKKGEPIYNLRGNVGEWILEDSVTVGGGWYDSRVKILQTDTFHITSQNAWTGFRNVSEWKEWRE